MTESLQEETHGERAQRPICPWVKEEERLYAQQELTDDDRGRLAKIKVQLDRYWDLLRQRRALREFGQDSDKARLRPADTVERYEQ